MKCENVGAKYICETDLELFSMNVLHILVNNRCCYFSLTFLWLFIGFI